MSASTPAPGTRPCASSRCTSRATRHALRASRYAPYACSNASCSCATALHPAIRPQAPEDVTHHPGMHVMGMGTTTQHHDQLTQPTHVFVAWWLSHEQPFG